MTDKPSITELWELAGGSVRGSPGPWRSAVCPLHNDASPSASVCEDEGNFKCFVCGLYGDGWDFIQAWKDIGFKEAKDFAARQLGLEHVSTKGTGGSDSSLRRTARSARDGLSRKQGTGAGRFAVSFGRRP